MATTYQGKGNGITGGNHASVTYYDAKTEGSHNNSIDNLLTSAKWGNGFGKPINLTMSFSDKNSIYNGGMGGITNITTAELNGAHRTMNAWEAVANITFKEINDTTNNAGDIRWAMSTATNTGYTMYPSAAYDSSAGNMYISANYTNPANGTLAYCTYLHEMGHALGLKHPHDSSSILPKPNEDQLKYTVMSYKSYAGGHSGYTTDYFPTTPMLNDISAMQFLLYGANKNYHKGNTIYSWSPSQKIYETIWDGGGNDTIDAHNQKQGVVLNLNSGQWSKIGMAFYNGQAHVRDCLTIAHNTVIENAIGSNQADKLIGNSAKNHLNGGLGNDTLNGGKGNDVLSGGKGKDIFVFDSNIKNNIDELLDFNTVDDTIQLDNAIFNKLTVKGKLNADYLKIGDFANDTNDYIIYNKNTGALFYDADGNGLNAPIQIAILGTNLNLTNADFVVV